MPSAVRVAHITGGGFPDNIPRVLPDGLGARLDLGAINLPSIFGWLARTGGIAQSEMLRTFNCGVGMIAVVAPDKVGDVRKALDEENKRSFVFGEIVPHGDGERICFDGHLKL
jgi:phosphoribosylformylglycinamidine cyclo-ligase